MSLFQNYLLKYWFHLQSYECLILFFLFALERNFSKIEILLWSKFNKNIFLSWKIEIFVCLKICGVLSLKCRAYWITNSTKFYLGVTIWKLVDRPPKLWCSKLKYKDNEYMIESPFKYLILIWNKHKIYWISNNRSDIWWSICHQPDGKSC